ncbi:calmodulin-lysine N-methyltransferase [Orussus abietinus]|uniref:calmodulin-lysine N-methyltransferase n=1 Tax=Orussus abietinus TaxID=222816 RepID=UPI000626A85F|nr:calmodulin-lysine N-methyltransferase [Orussus abietinus]
MSNFSVIMSKEILSQKDELMNVKRIRNVNDNTALRRWRLLAKALTCSPRLMSQTKDDISIRRFTTFGLVSPLVLVNVVTDPGSTWCEYSTVINDKFYDVQIRRINKNFTANELIGFNNTGNVCVWPSEECLAYYLLKNEWICRNKMVLELGGGMSCLAGIFAAKYCNPSGVALTDGNVTSVDNTRCIVARNNMADFVKCGVVQWARAARALRQTEYSDKSAQCWTTESGDESRRTEGLYNVILSADCLFFDDTRIDLVETIYGWLDDDGIALVMAPKRGTTFQKFTEAAIKRGFIVKIKERYDSEVWSCHLDQLVNNPEYAPDLHYPVLMELTKK